MKKLTYLFALAILLSGCATTAKYEALLNTWTGCSEESLIASWGTPQNEYHMSNGKKVIEYARGANVPIGGYSYTEPQTTYHQGWIGNRGYGGTSTTYVTKTTPVYNIPVWCKTSFIIDSNGRIESWRWEGNNCVSNYMPPKVPVQDTKRELPRSRPTFESQKKPPKAEERTLESYYEELGIKK